MSSYSSMRYRASTRIMKIKHHKVMDKKIDIERSISQKCNFKKVVTSAHLKLFCKGLPEGTTKGTLDSQADDIEPEIERYGEIQSIRVIERAGNPIAFVIFTENESTERLLKDQPLKFTKHLQNYLVSVNLMSSSTSNFPTIRKHNISDHVKAPVAKSAQSYQSGSDRDEREPEELSSEAPQRLITGNRLPSRLTLSPTWLITGISIKNLIMAQSNRTLNWPSIILLTPSKPPPFSAIHSSLIQLKSSIARFRKTDRKFLSKLSSRPQNREFIRDTLCKSGRWPRSEKKLFQPTTVSYPLSREQRPTSNLKPLKRKLLKTPN
jgi:hypothetical protein